MVNFIDQLKNMIDGVDFSDRVKDRIDLIAVRAKLREEAGVPEEGCLLPEEKKELITLVRADMVLDGLRIKMGQAYLNEVDNLINDLIRQ
jgi:hypothetical protein